MIKTSVDEEKIGSISRLIVAILVSSLPHVEPLQLLPLQIRGKKIPTLISVSEGAVVKEWSATCDPFKEFKLLVFSQESFTV